MKFDLKKNSKWIFYIISFLIFLFVLYYVYTYFTSSSSNKSIEKFTSLSDSVNTFPKSLIVNGSFQNGKRPVNYISQSGTNQIVPNINPTGSSYSLQQTKSDTLTYYELQSYCEDNSKYVFSLWTSFANKDGTDNTNNIDLSKIVNVRILKTDSTNDIPNLSYIVQQKAVLSDTNITWYFITYTFSTSTGTDNLMNLYLNYTSSLQTDYQYFTGLSLYKVLPEAQNYIYNEGLNLFLDGYHFDSTSKNWNDVSTYSNNFSWSQNPFVDTTKGFINSNNNILSGVTASTLLGTTDNPFTYIMVINQDSDDMELSGEEDENNNNEKTLLTIPGNNSYSIRLTWDSVNGNFICYLPSSKTVTSNSNIKLNNKCMLSICYQSKGNLIIYLDGNSIIDTKCDSLYYSGNDIIKINPDGGLNMNFYAVLNYKRIVSKNELTIIRDYFITNQDKDFSQISASTYLPSSLPSNFQLQDDKTISSYNRRDKYTYIDSTEFNNTYSNQTYMYQTDPKNCVPACNSLCNIYIDDTQKYHECLRSCKNVIPSCKNYCDDSNNKNSIMCESDSCLDSMDATKDCPIAYKRSENYMVYIKPETYYAKKYNYSGEKSYGRDLDKARDMYKQNFPSCKVPDILTPGEGNNYLNSCPFVIHEANPCFHTACAGVNWSVDNYKDLKMSDKCKKSVSYYCQINSDLDNMCACWKDENKNDPKCIEYRKFFENPNDYCAASQFNIEQHPDFSKFIRKDKIPCFGCNVE